MIDHRRALSDIQDIRSRIAAGTTFRGLGPFTLATTGAAALATCLLQQIFSTTFQGMDPSTFFAWWIVVAVLSAGIVGWEMVTRSRRHHSGMADAMILNAIHQFLPAGAAGAAVGAVLGRLAPDTVWMLPGLWQILVGIGVFSAARSLPKGASLAGAWYFVAGCVVLMIGAEDNALSPWTMGLPFVVGQCMLAAVVLAAPGDDDVG
jgi:hypothetical protein